MPPYFVNAATKSIGNSDLSVVTTTALANLLVAVGRDELRNVCVVVSDLTAAYGAGGAQIVAALGDLEAETGRTAMNLEPVRMNTDEFYHILRRRLFERLPDESEIEAVAHAYGNAVREAKQMDVTNASPEQFAAQIKESYPFHPAIRDLYARFRENQGFQQTRGLIRLMRIVVSRIWASDRDPYLIAAHDIDLGSQETLTEINQINNTLGNAIAHDIASDGSAVAERLDADQADQGGEDAQDVMRLLLIASLANVPNALKGLAVPEIVAALCAPGRDVSRIKNEVIARLATAAWYLHSTNDGRLHVRNVQNLISPRHDHRRRLPARPGDPRGQGTAHADLRPGRGHLLSAAAAPAGRRRDRCRRRARHADRRRAAPGRSEPGPAHALRSAHLSKPTVLSHRSACLRFAARKRAGIEGH